jgi:prevent-host-death family protein
VFGVAGAQGPAVGDVAAKGGLLPPDLVPLRIARVRAPNVKWTHYHHSDCRRRCVLLQCSYKSGYIVKGQNMPDIGIRQLKNDTSEILRSVREDKVEYVITYRGQPVAVLRPVEPTAADVDDILALAASVFAGFGTEELAEVEAAMRRRPNFFGENADA